MRYMFLIYSRELPPEQLPDMAELRARHWAVMDETRRLGILEGAEPLRPTSTATTVRMQDGKPLILDGPFAETKEVLLGFYIVDCETKEEALQIAKDLGKASSSEGCFEIRPLTLFRQNQLANP